MYQCGLLDAGQKHFVTANEFDKHVNHKLKKELPWINLCGSKARKKALVNAEQAFKRFFAGTSGKRACWQMHLRKRQIKMSNCIFLATIKVTGRYGGIN